MLVFQIQGKRTLGPTIHPVEACAAVVDKKPKIETAEEKASATPNEVTAAAAGDETTARNPEK
ncbi:MAG: hypothetical protein VB855_03675, partial [Pirellulaceae bacterium]